MIEYVQVIVFTSNLINTSHRFFEVRPVIDRRLNLKAMGFTVTEFALH